MPMILLLSGPIGSGKSELAERLVQRDSFSRYSTSRFLLDRAESRNVDRSELQAFSDNLDETTDHAWVFEDYRKQPNQDGEQRVLIDAIRKPRQIIPFRECFSWKITHVHLTAPAEVLRERFEQRKSAGGTIDDKVSYEEVIKHNVESYESELRREADLVIDTSTCDADDVYTRVAARLGLFAPPDERLVDVLIGGQYGSEGKGQVAAYLAREYDVLVRVGGPNAGHRVSSESGEFTYHHLPSGCRDTNARILIGAGAVINPTKLIAEVKNLQIDPSRLIIDENAVTISEADLSGEGQLKENISSTGQGVGFASARKIADRGRNSVILAKDHPDIKHLTGPVLDELERAYARGDRIFLEGTQGSGLSLHHGPYPHVTSRDTNVAGCLAEAGVSSSRVRRVVMVVRSYPIRVANPSGESKTSGPLKREIMVETIAERSGLDAAKLRAAEVTSTTGRPRRFGEFDWTLFRRSCALNAPTDIA